MSFFRKRQPSQTAPPPSAPTAAPAPAHLSQTREIPGPSEALKLAQQSQALNQRAAAAGPDDRAAASKSPTGPNGALPTGAAPAGGPQRPPADGQQAPPSRPKSSYPWSARQLQLAPPLLVPRPGMSQPTTPSPSPFPRYGHSLPPTCTASGELFIFGGLVKESVKDDLYSFSTSDTSCSMVQTTGDVPSPRVGHASALVSSVLIVWGGDTKTQESDRQDNALYLLNLGSREWTRVVPQGPAPAGRYGHAVTMCGTRFYVYGGQVDGEFLDDLWCFDLSSLKRGNPQWDNLTSPQGARAPAKRTGHVMVTYGDKLFLFGGTDGQYHYNDTWCYDTVSGTWSDLQCIGYIPLPREGHAAALVDDVMYIFGGRGVDGKDLGDLAAFKISNRRWYMFQHMGPSPSGRSGHSMAAAGSKVFVIGGESSTVSKPDDPSIIHVLETKNIRYPESSARNTTTTNGNTSNAANGSTMTPSQSNPTVNGQSQPQSQSVNPPSGPLTQTQARGPIASRAFSPQQTPSSLAGSDAEDYQGRRNLAASPTGGRRDVIGGPGGPMQPFPSAPVSSASASPNQGQGVAQSRTPAEIMAEAMRAQMRSPTYQQQQQQQQSQGQGERMRSPVQQRQVFDEDRDSYANGQPQGSEDDEVVLGSGSQRSREGAFSPGPGADPNARRGNARSPTPTNQDRNPTRAMSPTMMNGNGSSAHGHGGSSAHGHAGPPAQVLANRLAARSPSPVVSTPPPGDAFHYGSRGAPAPVKQTSNGSSYTSSSVNTSATVTNSNGPRAGSAASNIVAGSSLKGASSDERMRDRARDAELESARRRETWMRAALLKARSQGFVWGDQDLADALRDPSSSAGDATPTDRAQLQDLAIQLKSEYARLEKSVANQARVLSERFTEAERVRTGALQEAAFYRAKLAAYESGSGSTGGDIARLERERAAGLESQLASAMKDRQSQERKIADLTEAVAMQTRLREQAEDASSSATRRAESAEATHSGLAQAHDELQERFASAQATLRDHAVQVSSLTSVLAQRETEHTHAQAQLETLTASRDQHIHSLEQIEQALTLTTQRADEAEAQWAQSRERIAQLEADQVELRNEIESRAHEAEAAVQRATDAENAWTRSREEADGLRALTTGSLGKLLDSHRELKANEERGLNGQNDKITALEEEVSNLQLLLKESEKQAATHVTDLTGHRRRVRDLSAEQSTLHSQLSGLRAQLAEHVTSTGQLRQDLADREARLQDAQRAASDSELRLGTLRNYLAESGITIDIDELIASGSDASANAASSSRLRELEADLAEKTRQLETLEQRQRQGSRSGSSLGDRAANERAEAAERALADAVATHKTAMQRIEDDYQTAVHYVNRTEKMMRRVKDEHTRQKALNASLQSELDSVRSGSEASMSSRTRVVNGRITPLSDDSHDSTLRQQVQDLTRQVSRSQIENNDLKQKVAGLEKEVDTLRDALTGARREADLHVQQIEDLESEMDRLEAALQNARHQSNPAEHEALSHDNAALKRENELLQQRIGLLLDVDGPGGRNPNRLSGRPDSRSSSMKDHAFDHQIDALSSELDDWLATSASSTRRPRSEYDEPEIPQRSAARGPVRVHGS